MREGFTTGSCAAAAALAGCLWQRDGECPARVEIVVPEGRVFRADIIAREGLTCGVKKDAGDDPDITHGCEVRACVKLLDGDGEITFLAGEGVGVVTLPGLKLPVGEAAINPVPRQMIEKAVRSVFAACAAQVTVSIPGGAEIAQKTFNPRLGIEGGLSVLGTTGIVRPMSEDAIMETISLELSVKRESGTDAVALAFGNQGEEAILKQYPGIPVVQMSNYVGFALDEAVRLGFTQILIAGHPGKLAKVAAGVMQTHSKYGDARLEPIITELALMGAPLDLIRRVHGCVTTEAALKEVEGAGYSGVWAKMADAAQRYCQARVRKAAQVDIAYLSTAGDEIGLSGRMREDRWRWRKR